MIIVRGEARLPAGELERLRPRLERTATAARREPGCATIFFAVDANDPALLHIGGEWSDEAALDAHLRSRDMGDLLMALGASRAEWIRADAFDGHFVRIFAGEAPSAED